MSDQRRPTTRLGRVKRDPRTDSVPPSRKPEARDLGDAGDVDELLGRLLARATQAEVHAQQVEAALERMQEERVLFEARVAELTRQLELADVERASLEAQLRTQRRSDGPVTLAYVRAMAAELVRALERVQRPSNAEVAALPARKPSEIPTPRPLGDRPRR